MKANLYNSWVPVTEVVDIDYDDRRVYVKTHPDSEVWCLTFDEVILDEGDAELADDAHWLQTGGAYMQPQIVKGNSSPEWFEAQKEVPY